MNSYSRSIWLTINRPRHLQQVELVEAHKMELYQSVARILGGTGDLSANRMGQDKKMAELLLHRGSS